MATVSTKITPADHGRPMSLDDFEHAEVQPGNLYELCRGVIIVSDIPNPPHLLRLMAVKIPLAAYAAAHPGRIWALASGSECKILLAHFASERHPDLAIYKTPPPSHSSDVWWVWVPEIVIEIVSEGSEERDYKLKAEEYLAFGVQEYWIVDGQKEEILVLKRRGGKWAEKIVRSPEVYRTRLLPGFVLATKPIFDAGRAAEDQE